MQFQRCCQISKVSANGSGSLPQLSTPTPWCPLALGHLGQHSQLGWRPFMLLPLNPEALGQCLQAL